MVKTAVIIAAGNGIRLRPFSGDLPKPLVRVAGVPLIERVIRGALKAGIESFVVVTGYESDQIRGHLDRIPELACRITWIYNPDYELPNGGSVLKAREAISEDFALLMSDHLFDPEALARLLKAPRSPGECRLGVDRNLSEVYDLEDATKVRLKEDRIVEIGKTLNGFDAVDTGIFVCSTQLFDALADAASGSRPGCSLTDGVQRLSEKGLMTTLDLSDTSWHDIDTPEALKNAERFLYRSTRKPTDGPVSRLLNRHISIRFSRLCLYLGLSPNQISVMTFVLGLLAALSASYGDYAHVVIAGLLFQLSSILDGSDGEVAKLRMTGSVKGEWFDTILDCVTYLAFFVGVTVGLYQRTGTSGVLFIGFLTFAATVLSLSVLYFYLLNTGSGSLRKFAISFSQLATGPQKNLLLQVLNRLEFAIRRDFFSLLFCVFALFNLLNWIFAAIIIGIFMLTVGVAASAGRLLRERGGKLQGQSLTTEEYRMSAVIQGTDQRSTGRGVAQTTREDSRPCTAIILATDRGRQDGALNASAKLGGISLLDRALRTVALSGIGHATIVTDSSGYALRRDLLRRPAPKIDLSWIEVPVGVSDIQAISSAVLCSEISLVLCADCIYDVRVVKALLERGPGTIVTGGHRITDGGLCLLHRDNLKSLTTQEGVGATLSESLEGLLSRGEMRTLEIDDIPAYLPGLRKHLRPICFPVRTPEAENKGVDLLMKGAQKGTLDFPARFLHPPLENWTTRLIAKFGVTPNQVTLLTHLVAFLGVYLFATGRLTAAILAALSVGILDGVDGKLARLKLMYSDFGDRLEHLMDNVYEIAWYVALGYYLHQTGASDNALAISAWIALFYLLDRVVTGGFKHLKGIELFDYSPFDRFFRGFGGRRNIYVLILLVGILIGRPDIGLETVCGLAAVTFSVHFTRAVHHLLTGAEFAPSKT